MQIPAQAQSEQYKQDPPIRPTARCRQSSSVHLPPAALISTQTAAPPATAPRNTITIIPQSSSSLSPPSTCSSTKHPPTHYPRAGIFSAGKKKQFLLIKPFAHRARALLRRLAIPHTSFLPLTPYTRRLAPLFCDNTQTNPHNVHHHGIKQLAARPAQERSC